MSHSSYFLQSTLHCSGFTSFPSVHTSLIMFHFYFLQPTVHLIHFTYHSPSRSYLPYLVVFMSHAFMYSRCHSVSLVSFTFQPILYLECNNLQVSLDKFSVLDPDIPEFLDSGHKSWTLDSGLWTLDLTLRKLGSGACGQLAQNKIRTQFLNLLIL